MEMTQRAEKKHGWYAHTAFITYAGKPRGVTLKSKFENGTEMMQKVKHELCM